jgi:hypothetical protein
MIESIKSRSKCDPIYYTTTVPVVVLLLTTLVVAISFPSMVVFNGVVAEIDTRNDHDQSSNNIGLIGLGAMGTAFARCFIDKGNSVHVWNKSSKKVEDILDDRVNANTDTDSNYSLTIHSTPQGAFDSSNITFLVINSEPHLKSIFDDILAVNRDDDDDDDDNNHLLKSLKGKTIINTVTHHPFAAHDLDKVADK